MSSDSKIYNYILIAIVLIAFVIYLIPTYQIPKTYNVGNKKLKVISADKYKPAHFTKYTISNKWNDKFDYWQGANNVCKFYGMHLGTNEELLEVFTSKLKYSEIPQGGWFWTSSEISNDNSKAFVIDFTTGFITKNFKIVQNNVMCVKSEK